MYEFANFLHDSWSLTIDRNVNSNMTVYIISGYAPKSATNNWL
jgi:hypothetical protein